MERGKRWLVPKAGLYYKGLLKSLMAWAIPFLLASVLPLVTSRYLTLIHPAPPSFTIPVTLY